MPASIPVYVYLLRLRSGRVYVGVTARPLARWQAHLAGQACRTTRLDPPLGVLYLEPLASLALARAREAQLKGWSKAKKLALARGDRADLRRLSARCEKPSQAQRRETPPP